jgi:hypothetical protein
MFPRDHQLVAFNNTKLENLEPAPKLSCKLNTRRRGRSRRTRMKLSTSAVRRNAANPQRARRWVPTHLQPASKSNSKRDLFVAKSRREFATRFFCKVARRVRPSSPGGFAGLDRACISGGVFRLGRSFGFRPIVRLRFRGAEVLGGFKPGGHRSRRAGQYLMMLDVKKP